MALGKRKRTSDNGNYNDNDGSGSGTGPLWARIVRDLGSFWASLSAKRAPPKTFPFLSLPSELRNTVYDILAVDAKDNPVDVHKANTRDRGYHFARSSWGLTGVCRQTRDEFLPILRLARHARVAIQDVYEYLDAFAPPLVACNPFERAPATIELKIKLSKPDFKSMDSNIWPLIKAVRSSNGLRFIFGHEPSTAKLIFESSPFWVDLGRFLGIESIFLTSHMKARGDPNAPDEVVLYIKPLTESPAHLPVHLTHSEHVISISRWMCITGLASLQRSMAQFRCTSGDFIICKATSHRPDLFMQATIKSKETQCYYIRQIPRETESS
ncbi:hypothetical protein N0V90_004499 [Kalmusia sp. IMI 367209]|nr:hypothetical protein N0V90_004499 [Kalmusia sp. IMI 367209]